MPTYQQALEYQKFCRECAAKKVYRHSTHYEIIVNNGDTFKMNLEQGAKFFPLAEVK